MILIALGANLPGRFASPRAALDAAKSALETNGIKILQSSRVFITAPVPISDQPWYHNAVVRVETALSPYALLETLQKIENDLGRVRSERNAARVIDLDVIAYNDIVLDKPELIIPHPRADTRAFVLLPLRDVASNWTHPVSKKPLADLIAALPRDQIAHPQWFSDKPLYVMGIINATPDSFSDGGAYEPIAHAQKLLKEGADILDIGGESTRPGAKTISPAEEQMRILPVIEALRGAFISVDTRNAQTMQAALNAGAMMINDVSALTHDPDALAVIAKSVAPVCLMHMQGTPETMQQNPTYNDVVEDVFAYLKERIAACEEAGIYRGRIVADPGFGFGKTYEHNMALVERFERFNDLGVTLMAGVSRKKFIGTLMNDVPSDQRLEGSIKIAKILIQKGARIIRVHDVAAHRVILTPESARA